LLSLLQLLVLHSKLLGLAAEENRATEARDGAAADAAAVERKKRRNKANRMGATLYLSIC
jgi:hypothetical protein